ncbi:MAG: GAF domain-containing protein [Acidobacteria bacterium]|nr:GAF domain-containing protein [Acidobacteriota bacterium]
MSDEPLRVLLVDDDINLREPLTEFLQTDYDYHVDAAADAEQAWELVTSATLPYHVALIDDVLAPSAGKSPIRSGVDLMSHIKKHSPRTETIIFTGWGMERALEALQAGAFRYLAKPFNPEELAILIRHAAQQHHLFKELDTLKLLSVISDQLNLRHLDLETLLQETITRATTSIGAHEGSLLLVKADGSLHNWRGHELAMSDEKARMILANGCAKWVMNNSESLRLDDFTTDPRWLILADDVLRRGSALLVPLKDGDEAIGVFTFSCRETGYFKEEHQRLAETIATQAAIAIRHAALFQQTKDLAQQLDAEKQKLALFDHCSPNGQIAIDTEGKINFVNQRALQILGYTEEELIGKGVQILYLKFSEAQRIGKMLETASDHMVRQERTELVTKDGRPVPVLLSAAYVHDASGAYLGSIGHFENLTEIQKKDAQLAVLSEASRIMAEAATLKEGLNALARLLAERLQSSFCSIFLYNENSQTLVSKVSHVPLDAGLGPDDRSASGFPMKISDCALLREIFDTNQCKVIFHSDAEWRQELIQFAGYLRLSEDIQTLMLVPLLKDDRIVGLLTLGEVQKAGIFPFATDETDYPTATAIAHQITGLIDRLWQFDLTEYRNHLLDKLNKALLHIQGGLKVSELEQEITRYAAEVLDYSNSFLFACRPGQLELELCRTFPENTLPSIYPSSVEGLLGEVIRTGRPQFKAEYDEWHKREHAFDQFHFKTVVAVPLKPSEQIEYLLVVGSTDSRQFVETDEEMLERLAGRASLTLQNARLGTQKEKVNKQLNLLHQVSFYIQKMLGDEGLTAAQRLERLLHVTLTGVTAGYGLGFNRAALFLLDERGELVGKCGIGQFDHASADTVWRDWQAPTLDDFFHYTKLLEQGKIELTPVGAKVQELRFERKPSADDIFNEVLDGRHSKGLILEGDQALKLPDRLLEAFLPGPQLVVAPLNVRGHVFGVVVADNNFTRLPITEEDLKSLMTFVNAAAVAVENHNLFQQTQEARIRQEALTRASDKLVAPQDPDQVLQIICELTRKATKALFAGIILIDEITYRPLRIIPDEIGRQLDLTRSVRANGVSLEVMRGGQLIAIPDLKRQPGRTNPLLLEHGVRAAICLPFFAQGRRHGVLWVAYAEPHNFTGQELRSLQLYVNQAASTYDNARQMKELKATRDTAKVVAKVTTLGDLDTTLNTIVHGTKETTGCEPIVLFVYDQEKNSFRKPRTMVGVWDEQLASGDEVPENSLVYEIMKLGKTVKADDVSSDPMFHDKRFAREEEIKSCLAVPLRLGTESVGVLFVNNRSQHNFTPNEQRNIELFADQAAVAIRNTRLYEALRRRVTALQTLHEAGEEITRTLVEREVINKIIPWMWKLANEEGAFVAIRRIVGNEAVAEAYYPTSPPENPPIPLNPEPGKRIGITGRVVRDKRSYLVGDVSKDPDYLSYYPATKAELAVPIIIDDEVVYVINLEHPEPNAFDEEDKRDLESLATQAAIAIQNARKYKSLIEANVQIQASTELSWMDMVSGVWRHEIEGKAITIAAEVGEIFDDPYGKKLTREQDKKLRKIRELAQKIQDYKITPPVTNEEGVTNVSVNDLLAEQIRTRRENDPEQRTKYKLNLLPSDPLEVRISPDWFQFACDIVIDNAVRAVANSKRKEVTVTTSQENGKVEITFEDTGRGIPKKVLDKLFKGIISKEDGGEGLGGGLLKAQAIIKKYGGSIQIPWTSTKGEKTGTRVVIELPRLN